MWTSSRGEISVQRKWWKWWNEFRACTCYNQLQKYLRHCTVFWHKSPVHDPVLVIPPPPLIKVASNTRPYSKLGGTTLNGREEGVQYYILQTCDQEWFEARKVVFPWECLNIFATGCSYSYSYPLSKWSQNFSQGGVKTLALETNKNLPTCTQCSYIITRTWQLGILVIVRLYYAIELSNLRSLMYFTGKTKFHLSLTI